MDTNQPSQAESQAENNQIQQQQLQQPAAATAVAPVTTTPLTNNNVPGSTDFRCQWQGCGEFHPSAEVLYVRYSPTKLYLTFAKCQGSWERKSVTNIYDRIMYATST